MRSIRGKHTAPEIAVRRAVHNLGFRFRLHDANLPGRPDLVLRRHHTVIFVNGCLWHGHKGCPRAALPKSNRAFWSAKVAANMPETGGHTAPLGAPGGS